ncbi:SAM-dependent methyltransferase [Thioclava sp. SK-1]|uniref:RsmB/NOP family class I SAM-dependent RNA methyltransferase n=1 Tax=Thioclava sp. SK-1 TaxID=1889770 RepID=UPI000825D189|nr:RsmB/NOP family class I SAM-dependent RNA methyltransferase [Thioclava sp. SK-1]OCX67122.1 SAM-dependent methyltransferase [Thioclava sp. SK-1]
MMPSARIQAAIEILDRVFGGEPAERVLTNWARGHRFAGSKDRAAIRDHVFDALRCRGSYAALGGGQSGRALMLGWAREADQLAMFDGVGHGPEVPTAQEHEHLSRPAPHDLDLLDWPEWLRDDIAGALGDDFAQVSAAVRTRAPVFLRVNVARISRDDAQQVLAKQGVQTQPHLLADTALEITQGARRLRQTPAYLEGLVELQDASSQAAVAAIPLMPGQRVLDLCAGGGGKALAVAATTPSAQITAHDIDLKRMADIPTRAARAQAKIALAAPGQVGSDYDMVLIDAPCSGSGTWRRTPDAKWRLTRAGLSDLVAVQRKLLSEGAQLLRPGGTLVYMTCSLLAVENSEQSDWFCSEFGWTRSEEYHFTPVQGGDGFYYAALRKS